MKSAPLDDAVVDRATSRGPLARAPKRPLPVPLSRVSPLRVAQQQVDVAVAVLVTRTDELHRVAHALAEHDLA